jgi:hypothetical protein
MKSEYTVSYLIKKLWVHIFNFYQKMGIFSVLDFYPKMYAFWLLNDDELFDSFNPNMTRLLPNSSWYNPNTLYNYLTPVPSFTGKYALNFQSSYVLKVCSICGGLRILFASYFSPSYLRIWLN